MNIFDPSKSIVENLYLLSGPILTIFGFVAVLQLRLTKKAIIISSKRQAAELATKQIEIYCKQIIPSINELYLYEKKNNFVKLKLTKFEKFTELELANQIDKQIIINKTKERIPYMDYVLRNLNSMEAFATYFTKGVADEEIAYSSIGRTFCNSVDDYAFDLCICREDTLINSFNNIVGLYLIWSPRLKSEKLSKELEIKQKELDNLQMNSIDIIGVK